MSTIRDEFEALLPEPAYRITSKMGDFIGFRAQNFDNKKGDGFYTADQMRAIFDAATERAAKLCEERADALSKQWRQGRKTSTHLEGLSDGAFDCAAAIRAKGGDANGR
ncbi:hypothetical protein [Variovorax sp. GB1P17]|uniref:hypothetical protein n=1 Tax=Variovorax sp. GB1P17 TaxID=3443740 RepID=UPI003F4521DE